MYRFQKFFRKHKPALVTAATIALCLLLGITVSAWQAVRATAAEAQANANEQKATDERDEAQRQRDEVRAVKDQLQRTLYAAHMNLAKSVWDAGGTDRARELLDQHRPKLGQTDTRGFEWHYLNRLCNSELLSLQHGAKIYMLAYSPDGKRLASSGGNTVKIWDAESGREVRNLESPEAWGVAFNHDGQRIVHSTKGGPDGEWKIRDVQTGAEQFSLRGSYNTIVFSPDGKYLAGAGRNEVTLWDAQDGKEMTTLAGVPDAWLISAVFSPDGRRVAASGGQLIVWDVETRKVQLTQKAYSVYPMGVAFSPDGQEVACAGEDATVKVWNVQSGQERLSLENIGAGSVAFSHDGKQLIGGTWRNIVRIWDLETGKIVRTVKGAGMNAIYSPKSQRLAATAGPTIKIWDPHRDQEFAVEKRASVQSPPGKTLKATISADKTIKIQNAQSGRGAVTLEGHTVRIWNAAFSPDETLLASAGGGSDGGGVSRNHHAEMKIWEIPSGRQLFDLPVRSATVIRKVVFSPDGKQLASISGPMTVPAQLKIWDPLTGKELFSLEGHAGGGMDITYSPDGSRLASGAKDEVKLWDARTGRELFTFKNVLDYQQHVAFSSDGNRFAATSEDGAKVWDVQTGRELLDLKGHASNVRSVAFNPDGTRVATSSNDQTVKVWDALTGEELLTLELKWPAKVEFSADGHQLMVNSELLVHTYDATPLPEKQ